MSTADLVDASLDAEEALLGMMLVSLDAVDQACLVVDASDFTGWRADVFDAIVTERAQGDRPEPRSIVARLGDRVEAMGGPSRLTTLQAEAPSSSTAKRWATTVAEHSARRRLLGVLSEGLAWVKDPNVDLEATMSSVQVGLDGVQLPDVEPKNLHSVDDLVDQPEQDHDWVIPDLLERGDRMLFVAAEGVGKTTLLRQFGVMAAQGLHPLTCKPIPSVRALLVDCENPRQIIQRELHRVVDVARIQRGDSYRPHVASVWLEPGGIDLRERTWVARFDETCRLVRPDLVCAGPLYKMFRQRASERDEVVASEVTAALDDLRTRHGFALVLEHHAPKGGGVREMVPFGSSVWMRWPEFGPALAEVTDDERDVLRWGAWRYPRDERAWPSRLCQSSPWPFAAVFDEGMP